MLSSGGFSIREYAAKMRSVDVGKCWPFNDEINKGEINSLLPPISVKKFRWWLDELERVKPKDNFHAQQAEAEKPIQLEESRKSKASMPPKLRTPKKRSIVEIFAVAPQIERVEQTHDDDDDDEDKVHENPKFFGTRLKIHEIERKRVRKKMRKRVAVSNLKEKKKKFKKMGNKEKFQRQEMLTHEKSFPTLRGSLSNKKMAKDIRETGTTGKRMPVMKSSIQRRNNLVQMTKSIAERQRAKFPVRGILKNCTRISTMSSRHVDTRADPSCIPQTCKHVRFSGKDDIIGQQMKQVASFEHPKMPGGGSISTDALATSAVKDHSMEDNENFSASEIHGSVEDFSFGSENRNEAQLRIENLQASDYFEPASASSSQRPHTGFWETGNLFYDRSAHISQIPQLRANMHLCSQGNIASLPYRPYIENPGTHHPPNEAFSPVGTSSRPFRTNGKFDHLNDHIPVVVSTSMFLPTTSPQHLSSCAVSNEMAYRAVPSLSQSTTENYGNHNVQHQLFSGMLPRETAPSGWKKQAIDQVEKCVDRNFVGLPLNSQGEFIQLNSNANIGHNWAKKPIVLTSSGSIPVLKHTVPKAVGECVNVKENHSFQQVFPRNQIKLFPGQNYVEEKSDGMVSPRYARSELQSAMFARNICKEYDEGQIQKGNKVHIQENSDQMFQQRTQATMRLMGKDVTISRGTNTVQGMEDGKIWTDKEIITEHHPTSIALNASVRRSFQQDWFSDPAFEKPKDCIAHSAENQALQGHLKTKAPDFSMLNPYLQGQTNLLSGGSLSISGNCNPRPPPFMYPTSPAALISMAPNFQSIFVPPSEYINSSSQIPLSRSPTLDACPHIRPSSGKLVHEQHPAFDQKSSFSFPFSHPDFREPIQTTWMEGSSRTLPPWLIKARQPREKLMNFGQNHYDVVGKLPSVHHPPLVSFSCNPSTSTSSMQNPPVRASVARPPLIPVLPGFKQIAAANGSYRHRLKAKDRMKSKQLCGKQTKKRPAYKAVDSGKPSKIPDMKSQEPKSACGEPKETHSIVPSQHDLRAFEVESNRDKTNDGNFVQMEMQEDAIMTAPSSDCSKTDNAARSGPIKLTAGAKHILKPCQITDLDNSKPNHSTIRFVEEMNCGEALEKQSKSSKIYRF